jgi:uncharacterized protein (TIGR02679 family)
VSVSEDALAYGQRPGLARVWSLARERLEDNGRLAGLVVLDDPTTDERMALSGLLGARWKAPAGRPVRVSVVRLDRALRETRFGVGLLELLEALDERPVRSRPAERAATARTRAHGWETIASHAALRRHPSLGHWLTTVRSRGLHTRASRRGGEEPFALLQAALDVVAQLPADPPEGLPAFAARVVPGADTHALDRGTALDAVVVSALVSLNDEGSRSEARSAASRRAAYAAQGVICDELSVGVLVCGLRPVGDDYLATSLRAAADEGEPRRLTYRELRGHDLLTVGNDVFVCENPEIVAAGATRLGQTCPPLVCTEGWPSTACLRLLNAVCAGGATLRVRTDIDAAGLRIATTLTNRYPVVPWRMDAASYGATSEGPPWTGALPGDGDDWPDLRAAIRTRGQAQLEEQILELLLADLNAAS